MTLPAVCISRGYREPEPQCDLIVDCIHLDFVLSSLSLQAHVQVLVCGEVVVVLPVMLQAEHRIQEWQLSGSRSVRGPLPARMDALRVKNMIRS